MPLGSSRAYPPNCISTIFLRASQSLAAPRRPPAKGFVAPQLAPEEALDGPLVPVLVEARGEGDGLDGIGAQLWRAEGPNALFLEWLLPLLAQVLVAGALLAPSLFTSRT